MSSVGTVNFEITAAQIADLQRVLSPKQARQAVYVAVSRTTKRAKAIATKAVQQRLTIPRKYIDDEKNRHSALSATILGRDVDAVGRLRIKEKQLPLSAFKYRSTKRGVTVTVDKSAAPLTFRHAFASRVRSKRQEELGVGHTGIFVRRKVTAANAPAYFRKNRESFYRTAKRNAITPRGYAWRLPIGELFGPTILDFISRGEIRDAVLRDIGNELDKQLDSQISRFTKGRFKTLDAAMDALTADTADANEPTNA
jgi:hypothetical protein